MPHKLDFSKTIFILISGIGRGIGRAITMELGSRVARGSKIATVSNVSNILDKVSLVKEMKIRNPEVYFDIHMKDLSKVDLGDYSSFMDKFTSHPAVAERYFEYALIIHNAGSLGAVANASLLQNVTTWREYYNLNVFSPILLNSIFIRKCKPYTKHIFMVNITSGYTIQPKANLSMYTSARGARNTYFSTLAVEEADASVINYCPGLVETDELSELKEKQPAFKEDEDVINSHQTACTLLNALATGKYESGEIFNYYRSK